MAGKFETYKDRRGEFRYRLKARNGEIILSGEGYKSRSGLANGIKSIRTNSQIAERFEKRETKNGKPYFVLKAGNSQIIGKSETYESMAACNNGIKSVGKNAPDAPIENQI